MVLRIVEKIWNWELWPFWLRYLNITPMWALYCLKARSFWFFSASNPTLTFGGFEGESKKEMYEQLPPSSYPKTIYIQPGVPFESVQQLLQTNGFSYPFIVKPDVGMAGILFRKIDLEPQLKNYHAKMPVEYLVQELVTLPIEFSVFYYRYPNKEKGVITGLLQKEPMHIIGDGIATIQDLIQIHPKAKHRQEELTAWHSEKLEAVLSAGEKYYLTHAANLNRGGSFINLHHEIDARLLAVFDELNKYSKYFFYGRYDLKAASLADLKKGRNFIVLEYNGSGAEPNHVYNSGYTLRKAHAEILKHWKVLYEISVYNHKQGIRYTPFAEGRRYLNAAKKHFATLTKIDSSM